MKKVLWLASWYPNLLEPISGDFIERHARAASMLNSIFVIHVLKDHLNITQGRIFREKRIYNDHCQSSIIYYKVHSYGIHWFARLTSAFFFIKHFVREVRLYISQNGKPDLVHVHVSLKSGLIALWLKCFYNLPYVITEHWAGFCPEARPNFDEKSLLSRVVWKIIMKQASGCSTVSDYLGIALQSKLKHLEYVVIPNVVDTEIFRKRSYDENEIFRFIHISTLNYQKNPGQILEAIKLLSASINRKLELIIYGPARPELVKLADELNISDLLVFKKETSQAILARDMQDADTLILYSHYETFGCVIIEANACGLPVVVSDIPVLRENVIENITGIFAPLNQPQRLAEKLLWIMENRLLFRADDIIDITKKKYGFEIIAKQFDAFYNKVLKT